MTRINVFKTSTSFYRLFIILGSIFAVLGVLLIIKALINGFNIKFPSGDWNSVFYTIQGLLFIIMGAGNLSVRKYYIEWDDNELKFLLPDTKKIETIKLGDIISVTIRLFEIELKLPDKTRTLDLNNLQFEDLKKIKEKFENIKNKSKS
jgi:hypothetical protein